MGKNNSKRMHPYKLYDGDKDLDLGYFDRVYYRHLKLFVTLHKPAQVLLVNIIGLFHVNPKRKLSAEAEIEEIRQVIGFAPWEGKINLSQADLARLFNMSKYSVSEGMKELIEKEIIIKKDHLLWIRPNFFTHQKYFNSETIELFNELNTKKEEEDSTPKLEF